MVGNRSGKGSRFVWIARAGVVALLGSIATTACGDAGDANVNRPTAGAGGEGATGNTGNTGNVAGTGNTGNTGNTGGTGEPEPPCEPGERGCDGNTPRECNNDNEWVLEEKCGGATKVCAGEGECVPYRLLNAGIDSFGVRPAEGAIVLKEQTLSAAPKSCGTVGGEMVCVTGGIR